MKLLYSEEITASNKTLNGTSPNTFTTFGGIEKVTIYVPVEELGGTPDPEYFTREVEQSE